MPETPTKSFKVNNEVYDIAESDVAEFLQDMPDAQEVSSFIVGKDTFDIPIGQEQDFLADMPDAKPLKKKDETLSAPSYPTGLDESGQPSPLQSQSPSDGATSNQIPEYQLTMSDMAPGGLAANMAQPQQPGQQPQQKKPLSPEGKDYYDRLASEIGHEKFTPVQRSVILKTADTFEKKSLYKNTFEGDTNYRDVYFESLKKSLKPEDVEVIKQGVFDELAHRNSALKRIVEAPLVAVKGGVESLGHVAESLTPEQIKLTADEARAKGESPTSVYLSGLSKPIKELAHATFQLAGATPIGAAIYSASQAVNEIGGKHGEEINKLIFSYVSSATGTNENSPEWKQLAALSGDVVVAALFGLALKGKGKPIDERQIEKAAEVLQNKTPEQLQEISNGLQTPAVIPDIIDKINLENDLKNTDPASPVAEVILPKIEELKIKIADESVKISDSQAAADAKTSFVDYLNQTKEKLLAEREGKSEIAQGVIDEQVKMIEKELKNEENKVDQPPAEQPEVVPEVKAVEPITEDQPVTPIKEPDGKPGVEAEMPAIEAIVDPAEVIKDISEKTDKPAEVTPEIKPVEPEIPEPKAAEPPKAPDGETKSKKAKKSPAVTPESTPPESPKSSAKHSIGDEIKFTHAGTPKTGKIIKLEDGKVLAQDAMGIKYPVKMKDIEQGYVGKASVKATTGSGEPMMKASSIIEKAAKLFNIPIRQGHMRWGKRIGVFKVRDEVIRLKEHNDLASMTHEVAHHIDKKVFQRNYGGFEKELKGLDYDQTKQRAFEGFAEFVRLYMTGQKADAKAAAPGYYKYFEDQLNLNKELAKKINEIEADIAAWSKQGSEARILSTIDFSGKVKGITWRERIRKGRELWEDQLSPLRYALKDMMGEGADALRISEDPFRVANISNKTASAKAHAFVLDGVTDYIGNKVYKPLKEILSPFTNSRGDYESGIAYVVSKRKLDRADKGFEFPEQDLKDAKYVVDKYKAEPKYDKLAEEINKWNSYIIDYMADAGRLSVEAKQKILDSDLFYIPFKKVLDGNKATGATNKRFTDLGSPIKKFSKDNIGSPDIIDPIEAMIQNTERMINISDKTRIINMFIDLAEKNEGSGRWVEKVANPMTLAKTKLEAVRKDLEAAGVDLTKADMDAVLNVFGNANQYLGKDNIAAVWRKGKVEFYEFEKNLFEALKGSDSIDMGWFADTWLGKGAKFATQTVRLGATGVRAGFSLITNPIRDIVTAGMQSAVLPKGADAKIINTTIATPIRSLAGIFHAVKETEYTRKWKAMGGEQAQPLAIDRAYTQDLVQEALIHDVKSKVVYTARHPIDAIRKVFSFTEEGVRVGEFKKVYDSYKKLIDEAISKGDLAEAEKLKKDQALHASEAANNVTVNFKKAGRYAQILNQFVFGFNPALQGASSMAKSFKDSPAGTSMKSIALLTAPTLALWYMNKDEQWYKELPDWEKFGYWHFRLNDVPLLGDVTIRLPKPFEWGYLFASLPEATAQAIYDSDPQALKDLFKYGEKLLPPILPDVAKPAAEVYFNWNFFHEKPLISKGMENLRPEDQWLTSTSAAAKELGEIFGVSPIKIDQLLSGYTGGMVTDLMKAWPDKAYNENADLPVIGRLFVRELSINFAGKGVDKFYDKYEEARELRSSVNKRARIDNGLSPNDDISKAQKEAAILSLELSEEEAKLYRNATEIERVADRLSELHNKRLLVLKSDIPNELKKLALRTIGDAVKELTNKALDDNFDKKKVKIDLSPYNIKQAKPAKTITPFFSQPVQ